MQMCLFLTFSLKQMGRSEQTTHRFRRKAKDSDLSSAATDQVSTSLASAPSAADNLLCDNLTDSSIASQLAVSAPAETPQLSQSHAARNGACDAELTDDDSTGSDPSLIRNNGITVAADPAPHRDPKKPNDFCFGSYLPVELTGLPHSEITPLCFNQSLDLSACHVQKEDSLALIVFIYNSSSSDIQQLLLELSSVELEVR